MFKRTVADVLIQALIDAGVDRIYGIVGDSLNALTDALRRSGKMSWVQVRHEEVAAFAAGADAQLTGRLAVCAGSCGPGNLHLINGLYDCHRNRVPVLAIAAHIPSSEIGSGYFQETHPERLFQECSHYCELVSNPSQMPRSLQMAMQHAVSRGGVAVIVLPGDIALKAAEPSMFGHKVCAAQPVVMPSDAELAALAKMLNRARRVTLLCGSGCAGSHAELMQLCDRLKAPMVHALRGKEHVEYDNPYDVGMTGLIGFSSGYQAMMDCDALLMLGTDFPYTQFYPTDAKVAQVDIRPENLGRRCKLELGLCGDVKVTIEALLPRLEVRNDSAHLARCLAHYREARKGLDELATGVPGRKPIHPQYLAKVLNEVAGDDAIFTCDVGTPTLWAARYLRMNGRRRLLGSFVHGTMANALPQAIGAQIAYPGRQVIAMSGDGGLAMLMGDLLSLRQNRLPVKIVVFNNSALGFVEMEMKAGGYLETGTGLDNPDFAAMAQAIGMLGIRAEDPGEVRPALDRALRHDGPVIVDVATNRMELAMPPKTTAEQAYGFSVWMIKAVLNGRGDEVMELARTNILR